MTTVQRTPGSQTRSKDVSFFKQIAPNGEVRWRRSLPPAIRDGLAAIYHGLSWRDYLFFMVRIEDCQRGKN